MTPDERIALEARNLLAGEHDRNIAAQKLCGQGITYQEAIVVINEIYRQNQSINRKGSLGKLLLGGGGVILCVLLLAVTHRISRGLVFLLIASGGSAVWGLAGFLGASGYEIDS